MILKPSLSRIYKNATSEEVEKAMRASTALLRLRDVLEEEVRIPFGSPHQWAEIRSVNHHPHATTPLCPVGVFKAQILLQI